MRNCEDEDYAHGTEQQKLIDAEWMAHKQPQFAVGVGPQKYQRFPPANFDAIPFAEEEPKMSVAEVVGWVVVSCLMTAALLWGA